MERSALQAGTPSPGCQSAASLCTRGSAARSSRRPGSPARPSLPGLGGLTSSIHVCALRAAVGGRAVGSQTEASGLSDCQQTGRNQVPGPRGECGRRGCSKTRHKYCLSTLSSLFCTLSHILGFSCPLPHWESLSWSPYCIFVSAVPGFPLSFWPWQYLQVSVPWFLTLLFCFFPWSLCLLHPTLFPCHFSGFGLCCLAHPSLSPSPTVSKLGGCQLSFFPGKPEVKDFTSASWFLSGWTPAPPAG